MIIRRISSTAATRKFHKQLLIRAAESIDKDPIAHRDFSSMTFALDPEQMGCEDASAFTHSVYKQEERIVIAQKVRCKTMLKEDAGRGEEYVIRVLNSIVQEN